MNSCTPTFMCFISDAGGHRDVVKTEILTSFFHVVLVIPPGEILLPLYDTNILKACLQGVSLLKNCVII